MDKQTIKFIIAQISGSTIGYILFVIYIKLFRQG